MRYCVTVYEGSQSAHTDFEQVSEAYEFVKGRPHTCVSVYDEDGWMLNDYHFSPQHPIIGEDDLLGWLEHRPA